MKEHYFKTEGLKYYGVYFLGMPALTIRDPELIRQILVKDFDHFVDRQYNLIGEVSSSKTDQVFETFSLGSFHSELKKYAQKALY